MVAAGIVVGMVLLTLGCVALVATTTTTSPTATPAAAQATATSSPPVAAPSMTDQLDASFSNNGYIIVKPFTETKNQYNNVVYSGTIDDGDNVLQQYRHVLTIELVQDRNDALTRFDAYKTAAKASGDYEPNTVNDTGWWHGWSEQTVSTFYSVKDVNININEPGEPVSFARVFAAPTLYVNGITWDTYTVSVDYATHK
jgi:hypothetical protein